LNYGAGVFVASLDTSKFKISTDNGQSWQTSVGPAGCTTGNNTLIQLLTGKGIAVFLTTDGSACVSSDGGKTWSLTPQPIAGAHGINTNGAFVNGQFMIWTLDGLRFSSTDGMKWTQAAASSQSLGYGIGVTPAGTLLASNGNGYDSQIIYRSTDEGITWTALPTNSYVHSHPIWHFFSGYVHASSACPAH
jgi:photosystem II stability/assembly factor-like uncharacterized protein